MKCKHGLTTGTCWLCKGHKPEEQKPARRELSFLFENPFMGDNYLLDIQIEIDIHNCSGGPPWKEGSLADNREYERKVRVINEKIRRASELTQLLRHKRLRLKKEHSTPLKMLLRCLEGYYKIRADMDNSKVSTSKRS